MTTTTVTRSTCARGHVGELERSRSGRLVCRTCRRDAKRRHDARLRARRAAAAAEVTTTATAQIDVDDAAEWGGVPRVVVREDGVECYRIDEWIRRFGRPPLLYGQIEDAS